MANDFETARASAKVRSVELGTFGKNESTFLAVTFETADKRFPVTTKRFSFSSEAQEFMEKDLTTLGWNPAAHEWAIEEIVLGGKIDGATCNLVLENNPAYGWQVKYINSSEQPALKRKFATEEVKDFAARLRARYGFKIGDKGPGDGMPF